MTASFTRIYYSLPSATNARLRAISNATAIKRHFAEDTVLSSTVREAGPRRPSALPTRVRLFIGVPGVVEAT